MLIIVVVVAASVCVCVCVETSSSLIVLRFSFGQSALMANKKRKETCYSILLFKTKQREKRKENISINYY